MVFASSPNLTRQWALQMMFETLDPLDENVWPSSLDAS